MCTCMGTRHDRIYASDGFFVIELEFYFRYFDFFSTLQKNKTMPNNDTNWTTVSGKTKTKGNTSSNTKSTVAPVLPTAEVKSRLKLKTLHANWSFILAIKLSDSAFSSMKDRIVDENDENRSTDVKSQKPVSNNDKTAATKPTKPAKTNTNAVSLKQCLQNVNQNFFFFFH